MASRYGNGGNGGRRGRSMRTRRSSLTGSVRVRTASRGSGSPRGPFQDPIDTGPFGPVFEPANPRDRGPTGGGNGGGGNGGDGNGDKPKKDKKAVSKDASKVLRQIDALNSGGVLYDSQGLTTLSLKTIRQRLNSEQRKTNQIRNISNGRASRFDQDLTGDGEASLQILNGNNPITMTPARVSVGVDEYNLLQASTFFNSNKIMKMVSQIKTIAQQGSDTALNSYDDLFGEIDSKTSTNASFVDALSSNNIVFQKRKVSRSRSLGGNVSTDPAASAGLSATVVTEEDFPSVSADAVEKCLIDHFISPGEHLGVDTLFLRENLLIEDITKDNCNDCTSEGLEKNYGDVDMSALLSLVAPLDLLKVGALLVGSSRQAVAGGSGALREDLFEEEAPIQLMSAYEGLRVVAEESAAGSESSSASLGEILAASLHASMIQYVEVFMGYMVGEPDDTGDSIRLMKSPIFVSLTEEILQALETANLPVLCRLRPYAAPYESFELEYFEDFEPPLLDALPMFNSCFLLTPGDLSDFVSSVNPAVQTDLYTDGCEYYFINADGEPQEYVGTYHIHYDGTVMTDATHNPSVDHDILYAFCDATAALELGVIADRPEGCEPCAETRIDPEDNGSGRTFDDFITNLDDTIRGYFDTAGDTKSDFLDDDISVTPRGGGAVFLDDVSSSDDRSGPSGY